MISFLISIIIQWTVINLLFPNKSLCQLHQSIVVSCENGKKHIIDNHKSKYCIYQYKIDGDIVTSQTVLKCDYIVEVDTDNESIAFIIELKGSDVSHAIDQIKSTLDMFKAEFRNYKIFPRIICSSRVHSINSSKIRDFKKKYGKEAIHEKQYTDIL